MDTHFKQALEVVLVEGEMSQAITDHRLAHGVMVGTIKVDSLDTSVLYELIPFWNSTDDLRDAISVKVL